MKTIRYLPNGWNENNEPNPMTEVEVISIGGTMTRFARVRETATGRVRTVAAASMWRTADSYH